MCPLNDPSSGVVASAFFLGSLTSQNVVKVLAIVRSGETIDNTTLAKTWRPQANSWVIDQINHEEYILKGDQSKRVVTESEQILNPTKEELLQNDSRVFEQVPLLPPVNALRFYAGAVAGTLLAFGIVLKLSKVQLIRNKG